MTYRLGVDLGTTYTAAAVERDDQVTMVTLGTRTPEIPTVIAFPAEGEMLIGESAARRALTEPEVVAREFKRRVGDPVPIILSGTPRSPEALMAAALRHVVATTTEAQGSAPAEIVVTHPASWGPYKTAQLEQIFQLAGCEDAVPMTEPVAAARHYASRQRVGMGEVVAVFDFGGGTFDAAVLEHAEEGSYQLLGEASGIERLGGVDLDQAVFHYVTEEASIDLAALADTAANHASLARLRADCTTAKEALSSDDATAIPVMFDDNYTEVRLTRQVFEDMIRPTVLDAIDAIDMTVQSTGLSPSDISSILLVGGTSRIPLVSELVTAHFDRPAMVDTHPKHSTASGAICVVRRVTVDETPAASSIESTTVDITAPTPDASPTTSLLSAAAQSSLTPEESDDAEEGDRDEAAASAVLAPPVSIEPTSALRQRLFVGGAVLVAVILSAIALVLLRPNEDAVATSEPADQVEVSTTTAAESDSPLSSTSAPTPSSIEPVVASVPLRSIIGTSTGRVASGGISKVSAHGSTGPTSPPQLTWQLNVGLFNGPVPLDDLVYVGSPDEIGLRRLAALDAESGAEVWVADQAHVGSVIVTETAILNPTGDSISVLDPLTGDRLATIDLPLVFGSDTIYLSAVQLVNGELFAGGGYGEGADSVMFAVRFDVDTGDLLWQFEDPALGWTEVNQVVQFATDGETVVLASSNATVALDAQSGDELWRSLDLSGETTMHLDAGVLLTWPEPRSNVGIDVRTGDQVWEFEAANLPVYASDGDKFYVAVDGGKEVQARRLATGDLVWATEGFTGDTASPSILVIGGDLVYIVNEAGLAAAFQRTTGQLAWSSRLDGMQADTFGILRVSVGEGRLLVLRDEILRVYN